MRDNSTVVELALATDRQWKLMHFSISDDKARWPVKPATLFVRLQQRIGAELKEMASIFKPKIADNSFQDIKVFEADARGSFPGQVLGRLLFSIHISGSTRQLSFGRLPKRCPVRGSGILL
jgi:hypothetical protein